MHLAIYTRKGGNRKEKTVKVRVKVYVREGMNINPTNLKNAGYRGPYPQPFHGEFCRGLYQKTVHGQAHGKVMKSYFLNVLIWEFPNQPLSASVDVVFYQEDGLTSRGSEGRDCYTAFKVDLHLGGDTTIEQMEEFYAKLYTKLECTPDVHNND